MTKTYRDGAVGAMLDEHERAAGELLLLLAPLGAEEFELVRDAETSDERCRSIQTIVAHVVGSGYGYADYVRGALGIDCSSPERRLYERSEVEVEVPIMLAYLAATLDGRWLMTDEEITAVRMVTRWGSAYDLEQLLEHAIVHVLRHRRQIERFLQR